MSKIDLCIFTIIVLLSFTINGFELAYERKYSDNIECNPIYYNTTVSNDVNDVNNINDSNKQLFISIDTWLRIDATSGIYYMFILVLNVISNILRNRSTTDSVTLNEFTCYTTILLFAFKLIWTIIGTVILTKLCPYMNPVEVRSLFIIVLLSHYVIQILVFCNIFIIVLNRVFGVRNDQIDEQIPL